MDDARLVTEILPFLTPLLGHEPTAAQCAILQAGMAGLKQRAKTLKELAENAVFYVRSRPLPLNDGAKKILNADALKMLATIRTELEKLSDFSAHAIETCCKELAAREGKKLGDIAQPLRAALSGSNISPPIFESAHILGKAETLGRIGDVCHS
jgi:glutamyl-tRNA synthetase